MQLTESQIKLMDALYEIGSFLPDNEKREDVDALFRAGFIRFKGGEEIKLTAEGVEALMAIPEIKAHWEAYEAEWMAGVAQ
jgi:hypothetical protein